MLRGLDHRSLVAAGAALCAVRCAPPSLLPPRRAVCKTGALMTPSPNSTAHPPMLERRSEARTDPDWAREAERDPGTRYLITRGTTHLVSREAQPQIAFLKAGHPALAKVRESDLVLLGWYEGDRIVLVD